jgi:phage gpG-like protein
MVRIRKKGDLKIKKRFKILKRWKGSIATKDLAEIAKEHFKKGFPNSNTSRGGKKTDDSRSGWRKRIQKHPHPMLRDTGKLYDSIRVKNHRRYSLVLSSVSYAGYVNKVREFIGDSVRLERESRKFIENELHDIFNSKNPRYKK